MFHFYLLEHEIHFLTGKFEFCSEVGENKPSTGRATLTISCSHIYVNYIDMSFCTKSLGELSL